MVSSNTVMSTRNINYEKILSPPLRLNSICPYFTMFPLSFPARILSKIKPGEIVFDPFCGRGTTNYAARLHGNVSYGIDSNPVAQAIAMSKLITATPKEIVNLYNRIVHDSKSVEVPNGQFWDLAFNSDNLFSICKLRNYFLNKNPLSNVDLALRSIVLGVLHGPKMKGQPSYLSNQFPRTFSFKPDYSVRYWTTHSLFPEKVNILDLISRKAEYFYNKDTPEEVGGEILLGDSRHINDIHGQRFDWIITSPPYFGMSTYRQDQWLRLWFLGGDETVDYSSREQLKHWSEKSFIKDLSLVWQNSAKMASRNAKLVIRFGAIPSKSEIPPIDLLKESIRISDCGWRIKRKKNAGVPVSGKRQANQIKNSASKYIEEYDVYAVLQS